MATKNPHDHGEPAGDRAAAVELVRRAVEHELVQATLMGGQYPSPQQIGEMAVGALDGREGVDELVAERDAIGDELVSARACVDDLRVRLAEALDSGAALAGVAADAGVDRDTLLEAIGHVTCLRGATEPLGARLTALYEAANEIAKRTGYAGGQDGS